jgi:hypothetical protein
MTHKKCQSLISVDTVLLTMMHLAAQRAYNTSLKRSPDILKRIVASKISSEFRFKSSAAFAASMDMDRANEATRRMPDFSNSQGAFTSKTTFQLLRAALVYNLCPALRNYAALESKHSR